MLLVIMLFFLSWHFIITKKRHNRQVAKEKALWRHASKSYPSAESVEWLNRILKRVWTRHASFIEGEVLRNVNQQITRFKPGFLKPVNVELEKFSLGSVSPIIDTIQVFTTNDNVLAMELVVELCSTMKMLIGISAEANAKAHMPIAVENIIALARVRIEAEYSDVFPFVGNLMVTLVDRPSIDFEVKPFLIGDIMPLPLITPGVYEVINLIVIDQMFLFPNKFLYDVSELFKPKQVQEGSDPKNSSSVPPLNNTISSNNSSSSSTSSALKRTISSKPAAEKLK